MKIENVLWDVALVGVGWGERGRESGDTKNAFRRGVSRYC